MCLPMAAVAIGMMGMSSVMGAAGAIKSGNDAKSAGDYNAAASRQTAISIQNKGAQDALEQKTKTRILLGKQAAAGAANGIRTDTGTALDLAAQTAGYGELDALRITNNAQRQAYGYQVQANIDEWQGKQAQQASYLSAASSILGGASNAYFGGQKAGYWGGK